MAVGGADAMVKMDEQSAEALLLDHWLPDLEVEEFAQRIGRQYPRMDLLRFDGDEIQGGTRSSSRNELLHALRELHSVSQHQGLSPKAIAIDTTRAPLHTHKVAAVSPPSAAPGPNYVAMRQPEPPRRPGTPSIDSILHVAFDEMVGQSEAMRELARMIWLVAPRKSTVLIEGETGTGKEVVARAVHRLSPRSGKPLVILNCAAIPEALLEAELFGHTRGAFSGATQSRRGRIEVADGGTLFLDEIGEMPMILQAKILRFLESGELQRVGDNEITRVDVRVIAATHQHLEKRASEGTFRLDLYHRLAVFPVEVPPLRDRTEDIAALCEHFLDLLGKSSSRMHMTANALDKLLKHDWPGNVRELAHVLERAYILAGDSTEIQIEHIRLRRTARMR
jgi:DNA-binding NtrC family response regulator